MLIREQYDLIKRDGFVCGCEFEIEDINVIDTNNLLDFEIDDDPSLRNNGKEFKTLPSDFETTLKLFKTLHSSLALGPNPFTERTSIHVHVNISELSLKQAREFVLLYALVEPLFFNFVGKERQNNIYCVPLNYTYLPSIYSYTFVDMLEKWHKYTAFNILPVTQLGTVEFRHLYGTNSFEIFSTWLTAIKELYDFIVQRPRFSILKVMAKVSVHDLVREIVPTFTKDVSSIQLDALLSDSQLDVKLAAGGIK